MLTALDLFGVRPIWYIGGQKKNTTSNGYLFSFGLLSFALWMIILLSHDLVNRANPQVTKSTQQGVILENPMYLNMSEFQYMYGIVEDNEVLLYNTSIFTVEATVFYNNYTTKSLNLKNCTVNDIENIVPYEGVVFCLDEEELIYYDGVNAYVEVKFKACENSTENDFSCASQQEINERMSRSLFLIFFPVYSILPNNYQEPLQMKWNYVSYTIDVQKTKILNTLFKMAELQTDDGWLTTSISSVKQMIHDSILFDIGSPEYYDCMIDFQTWTLGDLDIIYRRFTKFQDFLAQAFGLIQFIVLGLSLVFIPYARYKMYEYIGNHIYDLNIDTRKNRKRSGRLSKFQNYPLNECDDIKYRKSKSDVFHPQSVPGDSMPEFDRPKDLRIKRHITSGVINESVEFIHHPQEISDFSNGFDIPQSNYSNSTMASGAKEMKGASGFIWSFLKKCRRKGNGNDPSLKYKLSVSEYFFSLVRNSPKKILLERVENEIIKNLDILSFCKKMVEFELLKNYLLSQNQQALFSNLPRPKINLKIPTDKKSFNYKDTPQYSFRIDSVLKSRFKDKEELNKIMEDIQKKEMNSIDLKLLSRFKPLIKPVLENIEEEG